jgi:protein phosphatase
MLAIESTGISDIGKKRKQNEDSLLVDDDLRLYIVADGMGGHLAGEVASKLVVETIGTCLAHSREQCDTGIDSGLSKEADKLLSAIKLANRAVHQAAQNDESCQGMGSTVAAVCFSDDTLIAANVGDSPVYLVRNGNIELLSVTHNVFAEYAAKNIGTATSLGSKFKHVLTRAVGVGETVHPDIREIQYADDDVLIISSDGLSDKVSAKEILDTVGSEAPAMACKLLVDLANARGGDDNISVIVLKIKADNRRKSGVRGRIASAFCFIKNLFV